MRDDAAARVPAGALERLHAEMLRALGESDPALRGRRMLRAHVERTLIRHFGDRLAQAPHFQDIVSQVTDALLSEPALEPLIDRAADELRSQS